MTPSLWVDGLTLRGLISEWAGSFEAEHERKLNEPDVTLTARQALVERTSVAGHPISEMTISRILNGRKGRPVRQVPLSTAEPLILYGLDCQHVFANGVLPIRGSGF